MRALYLPLIAVLLFIFGFVMIQVGKQQQIAQVRQVYAICQSSHYRTSGAMEQACGDGQDRTHTEFVCNATYCWLEIK